MVPRKGSCEIIVGATYQSVVELHGRFRMARDSNPRRQSVLRPKTLPLCHNRRTTAESNARVYTDRFEIKGESGRTVMQINAYVYIFAVMILRRSGGYSLQYSLCDTTMFTFDPARMFAGLRASLNSRKMTDVFTIGIPNEIK